MPVQERMTGAWAGGAAGRDRSIPAFWLMLGAFVALWTIVPAATQHNLPLDSIEMVQWGREWQLGYYKHPPLPAWVAELTTIALGEREWPVYLVAELATAVGFWAIWRLGRELLPPWHALCAVAMLQGCYHFNWATPDVNNNTITRPFWAVAVLMMYWALTRRQFRYWIGYGAAMGLGLWSKYDVLCLGAGFTWLLLKNPDARRAWRTPGPYAAAALIVAIILPHVAWLIEHEGITLQYAAGRADDGRGWSDHLVNPLVFCAKQLPVVLPVLALGIPLTGFYVRRRKLAPAELLPRDLLIAASVAPAILAVVLAAATGARLRTGWTSQFWCHLGVLALFCLEVRPRREAVAATLRWCGAALGASLLALPVHHAMSPLLRDKPSRVHFPGDELARAAESIWHETSPAPLPAVACRDWWVSGNICFYGDAHPSAVNLSCPEYTPWYSDAELNRTGGILVESLAPGASLPPELLAEWRSRFAAVREPCIVTLDYPTVGRLPAARFVVATVPPEARLAEEATGQPARR